MTFFHPDYTVGPGVSPDLPGTIARLAGSTADRELPAFRPAHPALKVCAIVDLFYQLLV
jgi:hypothetical protein